MKKPICATISAYALALIFILGASEAYSSIDPSLSIKSIYSLETEIASSLLGMDEGWLKAEIENGNNAGQMLLEAGKIEEFKKAFISEASNIFNACVEKGILSKAEARFKFSALKKVIEAYDGSYPLNLNEYLKEGSLKPKSKGDIHIDVYQIAAKALDKPIEEVQKAAKEGKLCNMLLDAGKLEAFKAEYLNEFRQKLDEAAEDGIITKDQADKIYFDRKKHIDSLAGMPPPSGGKPIDAKDFKGLGVF